METGDALAEAAADLLQDGEDFDWAKQWYNIGFSKYMDTTKPYPIQLLGKRLVLWKDSSGTWRCFQDRCPHRGAPLSEGKLWPEEDTLMCSYHGWRFNPEGTCVRVPQAASETAERIACSNRRSCVGTHPVIEAQGMVFVWGDSGPNAESESAAKPPPICQLTQEAVARGDALTYVIPPVDRYVPYDYSTLVENVADPAHVPFAHHGIQGNRDKVKYGDYNLMPKKQPDKLAVTHSLHGPASITFEPPGIVNYVSNRSDGTYSSFRIYATPTAPGQSRLTSFLATNRKMPFIFDLLKLVPSWMDHILFRHPVLDGDNVYLLCLEHDVAEQQAAGRGGWRKYYFMPTAADTLVAMFRNWMDKTGKGGPFGPLHNAKGYGPLITDHRVLLNRFEQHTKHCKACSGALVWVERARAVAGALSALGIGAAVATWMQIAGASFGAVVRSVAPSALVGLGFGLVWYWLSRTRQAFYFVDYDHALR